MSGLRPGNRWIAETTSDVVIELTTAAGTEPPTVAVTVPVDALSFRIRQAG